ncbi:MAG: Mfa1 fimbrilin C-terminal domain-containing protein [Bacteroides sp.]|nr:Mfa1 fimbrilin C-terminal domain-containing protein [Roseburia sp.]MCM1347105.1 Mfa1 fimbrilin C-terminal domain-containing protein [Bacteroides sp.]MCM1420709.1 Mfa1 fimbrilin C-terminal domain-containing protein [Bacteroides sp.]
MLDRKCIKNTREDAEANPAGDIYVERTVAKTTVNAANTTGSFNGQGVDDKGEQKTIAYKIDGWRLTNTNPDSYLVRNVIGTSYLDYCSEGLGDNANKYRFVGSYPVETKKSLYRYYWALDPNYEKTVALTQLEVSDKMQWNELGDTHPEYCKENTFTVAYQKHQNTTAVVVKATLDDGKDFYTVNDANEIYKKDDAISFLKGLYLSRATVKDWFEKNCVVPEGQTTVTFDEEDFDLNTDYNKETGFVTTTGVKLTEAGTAKVKEGATIPNDEAIFNYINETKIKKFIGGAAYYVVYVQHFGDDLTPWNSWEPSTSAPSASAPYPGNAAKNYLGRYGMVRNNWYDISISAIKKIGSPVVPNLTGDSTPDDEIESYISVRIKVLSWAKRTQSVIL